MNCGDTESRAATCSTVRSDSDVGFIRSGPAGMHLGNPSASSEACYAAVMLSDTKRSFVPMMTHKDFWEGRVTRDQYCSSVAKAAGIDMSNSPLLPRVREAMARGDEQMSNI